MPAVLNVAVADACPLLFVVPFENCVSVVASKKLTETPDMALPFWSVTVAVKVSFCPVWIFEADSVSVKVVATGAGAVTITVTVLLFNTMLSLYIPKQDIKRFFQVFKAVLY